MKDDGKVSSTRINLHVLSLSSLGIRLVPLLIVLCFVYLVIQTKSASGAFLGDCQQPGTVTPTPADPSSVTGVIDKRERALSNLDRQLKFEHISVDQGLSHNSVTAVLQDSTGFMWPVSIALSLFPLTSPIAMIARLVVTDVPFWQPALAAILLVVSVIFILRLTARMFRAQILLSGQSLSVRNYYKTLLGQV